MHRTIILFLAVCALLAAAVSTTAADEPVAVAVLNFANQVQGPAGEEWDWLEKGLADLIINDLSLQKGLLLVDRERMQETLTAEGIPITPGMDLSKVRLIFVKRFKVARLVFGSYRVDGEKITLNATVMDAYSGRLIKRLQTEGAANDVLKLQKKLASQIIGVLLGRGDVEQIASSLPVWTESLPASKLLYTAIDKFDQGQFSQAWLYARRAWRADPVYADALYWVGSMHYYMLQYPHARRYFEQFVYEHTTHPRIGDAVIEYLDTYERAASDTHAKIDEIQRVIESAPPATVSRISHRGMHTWPLQEFLKARMATYYQSTTEYPRATRVLEDLFAKRPSGSANSGYKLGLFYDEVRMQTGVVLGQPTSVSNRGRTISVQSHVLPANVRMLRPGDNNEYSVTGDWREGGDFFGNELLIIPPNHKLSRLRFSAVAHVTEETKGYISQLLACLKTDGSWRLFGQECSEPVTLSTKPGKYVFEINPLVRGKLFQAALQEWCHKVGTPQHLGRGITPYRISDVRMSAEIGPAYVQGHYYLELGSLGALQYGTIGVNGRAVSCGRQFKWLTYLGEEDLQGHYYRDDGGYPAPRGKPLVSFTLQPQNNVTKIMELGPRSGTIPGSGKGTRCHRIATGYSPAVQGARQPPCIVAGLTGQWVAVWEVDGELWLALSSDQGKSWTPAKTLPVPVNSGHREWDVRLVALAGGEYALSFKSDRGIPIQARSYLSYSRDLRRWTIPRLAPIADVQYASRGAEGELMLAGWDETGWSLGLGKLGSDDEAFPPGLWIARAQDGLSFDLAQVDLGELQQYAMAIPAAVWYDKSNGQYHCVLIPWFQWNDDYLGLPLREQWCYRPCEYVGTQESGLKLLARFEKQAFTYEGGMFFQGKLVLLYESGRAAYIFERPTLDSPYKTLAFRAYCLLSDISPDGRLLAGVSHATTGDDVYMYELDIAKEIQGRQAQPPKITSFAQK